LESLGKKTDKKWRAQLIYKGKKYSAGYFDNEEYAAMNVNLLCDKFEIKRKNPMIDIKFDAIRQVKNPTSKYTGVCWITREKKWRARLTYNGEKYCCGYFDNEEESAMSINLLCDKLGIQRKNTMIDIEPTDTIRQKIKSKMGGQSKPKILMNDQEVKVEEEKYKNTMINIEPADAIQQKTKSSKMYGSKAENIVNEKEVKVEEETIIFGLKDQCEDNFIKQTCQNQKRKRKEDSILNAVIEKQMINTTHNHDQNEVFEEIQKEYIKTFD